MTRTILTALALVLAMAVPSFGNPLYIEHDSELEGTGGTKVDGLALTAGRWTGWIRTAKMRSIVFDIDFTDADSSVTAVTMVCESSMSNATAADAGEDLHSISVAAGVVTSSVITWTYTTGGSKKWSWTVSNVPASWLNCEFDATGTPAAADVVTVVARGVTP